MANTDAPRGFTPVKHLNGSPWNGQLRSCTCGAEDIFIGDMISIASGLAVPADTGDAIFAGVAVGFGKKTADGAGTAGGAFDPGNLNQVWFDTSAVTASEYVCYYVPAEDMIFECQTAGDYDAIVGATIDLLGTGGDTNTGRSKQELSEGTANGDFIIVELPGIVDNDPTLDAAKLWVTVARTNLYNQ